VRVQINVSSETPRPQVALIQTHGVLGSPACTISKTFDLEYDMIRDILTTQSQLHLPLFQCPDLQASSTPSESLMTTCLSKSPHQGLTIASYCCLSTQGTTMCMTLFRKCCQTSAHNITVTERPVVHEPS
jgi:hypothetical protein